MLATFVLGTTALLALGYALVCSIIALRFTTAHRKAPVAPAEDTRTVRFASRHGNVQIAAWYSRPTHCSAAVVFVHGKDTCRGDELRADGTLLADALGGAGIALLRIDLRGHGTSSAARLTYGQNERNDVLGALDWLQAQGHRRIGLLGASMGAVSALLAAADEPSVAALVIDSAFADFATMIERQYDKLCCLPRCFLPGALAVSRLLTGVDLTRLSPLGAAPSLRGRPVLIIHSEGDRFIPAADGRALAAACGARLWTTDTPGHLGSYRAHPAQYTARVLAFFAQHLCDGEIGERAARPLQRLRYRAREEWPVDPFRAVQGISRRAGQARRDTHLGSGHDGRHRRR